MSIGRIGHTAALFFAVTLVVAIATGAFSCDPTAVPESSNSGATTVRFEVWGNAPSGVEITYGGSSTNLDGRLPLDTTLTIDPNELYYAVSAQLQGGGDVQCRITIGDQVRSGQARGDYNICSAQLNGDFNGGWG